MKRQRKRLKQKPVSNKPHKICDPKKHEEKKTNAEDKSKRTQSPIDYYVKKIKHTISIGDEIDRIYAICFITALCVRCMSASFLDIM